MTIQLNAGDSAPDFIMPANGAETVKLADFSGKNLILYFYPKDDTPGCTTEAIEFSAASERLSALNTAVVGVSRDTVAKHDKFIAKHDLSVQLGSDEDGEVCNAYGVWVEKKNYGRTYMGIERSTFLIGPEGDIKQVWRKVRVKGHVDAVIDAIESGS